MVMSFAFCTQRCNDQFIRAKSSTQSQAVREDRLKALVAAFNSFNQLKSNLEEGTKVNLCHKAGGDINRALQEWKR